MGRRFTLLAALVVVLSGATNAAAATPQQFSLTVPDGTVLACSLVEPDGAPPAGGWPGVILLHGLGGRHQDMEPFATQLLAPAGYAALECDARGHGASGGLFGLAGPSIVDDVRQEFNWLAARPEVSDTQIGGFGVSLGGGTLWNAATQGVPFKAIVPAITWVDLQHALAPQSLPKVGLILYLANLVPESRWRPDLLAAKDAILSGNLAAVKQTFAMQQSIAALPSFATPTLLLQGRHDFLFDIDQALTAYRLLKGPKRLYLGDLGHPPAANPTAEQPAYFGLALKWFDRFLKGTANGVDKQHIELAHDPWDGKTTLYPSMPPTKMMSVTLPGSSTITGATGKVVRSVRFTGGPHETFGDSTVVVRYSGAQAWDRLVAVVVPQGTTTPISAGGVKITGSSGKATIKLLDEAVRFPAGKKLVVYVSSTSLAQDPGDALYVAAVSPQAKITIGRVTLNLSVLKKAVSR